MVSLFWSRHQALYLSSPPPFVLSLEKNSSLRGPFYGSIASPMNCFERSCLWSKFASSVTNFFKDMCFCFVVATFFENTLRYICSFFTSLTPSRKSSKYNYCFHKWTLSFNKVLESIDPFQIIPFLLQKLPEVTIFIVSHLTTSLGIGFPFLLSSFL